MTSFNKQDLIDKLEEGIKQGKYPEKVYKFRGIDKAVKIITSQEFYFSNPTAFNDPFDCSLDNVLNYSQSDVQNYLKRQKNLTSNDISTILSVFNNSPTDFNKIVNGQKETAINKRGVLALGKSNKPILLWSHYAQNHEGVAIELDLSKDPDFFLMPRNIEYVNNYTPLNYLSNPEATIDDTLGLKSEVWKYEEEFRVYKNQSGAVKIKPEAITGIYFGLKSSQADIDTIKNLCINGVLNHVKFYKAERVYGVFQIDFKPI